MTQQAADEAATIVVIDDDPSIRESLQSLLRSVGHKVRLFESTQNFLLGEAAQAADCLVLDVRLPGQSGLEFQRELAKAGIAVPIVFITGHGDIPMSVAAMKAGAVEFLTKPFHDQELLDAVQRGIALERGRRVALDELAELRQRFATLSPREREVMALVCAGQMNKQIAGTLRLSEITVKVHRGKVMRKMQARTLPDLVRIADRLGGLTPGA